MKNIFLKNGISLFGALLLSQASFCSDNPINQSNRLQAMKRKHSETLFHLESGDVKRKCTEAELKGLIEDVENGREDQLTAERFLKVLPDVLNNFNKQFLLKTLDPNFFRILMAAALKIDPFTRIGKNKTLYMAVVDAACNGGNLDEHNIAIFSKQLEKNFFELDGLSYSFAEKRIYDPSFKEFNEYMKYMKGVLNSYQTPLNPSDHESICKAFSTIFYVICRNIRKDNAKGKIDFKSDPVYQDNQKISRISQMIWDIYQDTSEIEYIGHLLVDLEDMLAIDDLLLYKLYGDNELQGDNKLLKYFLPFDLPDINVNPIIDLVKKKLKSDTDRELESDTNEEVYPLYEKFLTLVILLSKVNPKKLLFGGKTPCSDLLDRFIDTGAISCRDDTFKIVANNFLEAVRFVADKQQSQENLLKIIVSWLKQLILYEEEAVAYEEEGNALVEEISENSLTQEDPSKELQKKIYVIKIQCLAEILCIIFQRYFDEHPEDPECNYMKRYCWQKIDEWKEKCEEWAAQDKKNKSFDSKNFKSTNNNSDVKTNFKQKNPYFYCLDNYEEETEDEKEACSCFITIEKSEMDLVLEDGINAYYDEENSDKIKIHYEQTPQFMKAMEKLFNDIRDIVRKYHKPHIEVAK